MVNNSFWKWDSVIDRAFCDYVLDGIDWESEGIDARFKDGNEEFVARPDYRQTKIAWRDPLHPISACLHTYIRFANEHAGWDFDIKTCEYAQIGKYEVDGHYSWHKDTFTPDQNGFQRKLTAVMLLNDPSEYTGGVLEIKNNKDHMLKTVGSIVVFPSFLEHRVTEITEGVRYSATCWAVGPAFK